MSTDKLTFSAGSIIADRYRLESVIGTGSMATVWRAEHIVMGRIVALKLLDVLLVDNDSAKERFVLEARTTGTLNNPHVVHVHDAGAHGDVPYLAMELLDGESLRERLRRDRVLSPLETLTMLQEIGSAMSAAHEAGIVHRDLSPRNIFLEKTETGLVTKVLDFGIAKLITPDSGDPSMTATGEILGTPSYMSPEQLRSSKSVDHRTDLWAIAVMAFECLLGERPYVGGTFADLVLTICFDPAPIPSEVGDVPRGFDDWYAKATNPSLDERFRGCAELVAGLEKVLP